MRIISSYKDFYDGLSQHDDRPWKRETSSIVLPANDLRLSIKRKDFVEIFDSFHLYLFEDNGLYERCFLFFCGKIFPYLKCEKSGMIYWNFESFSQSNEFLTSSRKDKFFNLFKKSERARRLFIHENAPIKFLRLGIEFRSPIINIKRFHNGILDNPSIELTLNPNLKDLGFQKIMSLHDAFLEIDSYLFNELASDEKNDANVSDKIKIDSHGFDRFSFRKDPSN